MFYSLHYGSYTCEGCKVFFRRGEKKYHEYKCRTGKKDCIPEEDFAFPCKYCRFYKCLSAGMSRNKIKIGRYSKKRKRLNEVLVHGEEKSRKVSIPSSPSYSITDDIIDQSRICIQQVKNIIWRNEIEDLDEKVNFINEMSSVEFFEIEDYMDIVLVTGIEPDNRKIWINLSEEILAITLKYVMPFIQCLPGIETLSKTNLILKVLPAFNLIALLHAIEKRLWFEDENFVFILNGKELKIKKSCFGKMASSDPDREDIRAEYLKKILSLNVSQEDIMLLMALSILRPNKDLPQLKTCHDQILLVLHEYLSKEEEKYIDRLRDIIEFINIYNKLDSATKVYYKSYPEYVNFVYKNPAMKGYSTYNTEKTAELLAKLVL